MEPYLEPFTTKGSSSRRRFLCQSLQVNKSQVRYYIVTKFVSHDLCSCRHIVEFAQRSASVIPDTGAGIHDKRNPRNWSVVELELFIVTGQSLAMGRTSSLPPAQLPSPFYHHK